MVVDAATWTAATAAQPSEESVCDPLLADDGVTKGLYGLCAAFCEAQDIASTETAITSDELEIIESSAPSGRILANYNKKKKATDPDMPCILVDEPCPCWTSEELAGIDALTPTGDPSRTFCQEGRDPMTGLIHARRVGEFDPDLHAATAWDTHTDEFSLDQCRYINAQVSPLISRVLSVGLGTLTREQAGVCLAQVNAVCADLGHGGS